MNETSRHRRRSHSGRHVRRRIHLTRRVLFGAYLLGLVLLPWFYGGNRDWAWGLAVAWFSGVALFALLAIQQGLVRVHGPVVQARWALWLWAGWLLFGVVQLLPIGWDAHPASLQLLGVERLWTALHVDPGTGVEAWLKQLLYFEVFVLTLLLLHRAERARRAILVLVVNAALMATVAVIFAMNEWAWRTPFFMLGGDAGAATGAYANKNHFAGYLELCLALGLGLVVGQLRDVDTDRDWRQRLRDVLAVLLSEKTWVRLASVVLVIALVLTLSRMGNLAFFGALLLVSLLTFVLVRERPRHFVTLVVSVVVLDLLVIGSWFGSDDLARRVAATEFSIPATTAPVVGGPRAAPQTDGGVAPARLPLDAERALVTESTLRMWRAAPWFGHGGGSFRTVFPEYRSAAVGPAFYDHAHNDHAQLLAEYGLFGAALWLGWVGLSLAMAVQALRQRRRRPYVGLAFASLLGGLALLLHGSADFNLQIPANASYFALLLALAWVARHGGRPRPRTAPGAIRSQSRLALAALALTASGGALSAADRCAPTAVYPPPSSDLIEESERIDRLRLALRRGGDRESVQAELGRLAARLVLEAMHWQALGEEDRARQWREFLQGRLGDSAFLVARLAARDPLAQLAHIELRRTGWLSGAPDEAAACWLLRTQAVAAVDASYRRALCERDKAPEAALRHMHEAARGGHPAAAEALGRLCLEAEPPDVDCALTWLCRAGVAGRIEAALLAAYLASTPDEAPRDLALAHRLYERAAAAGHPAAANNLGELIERGLGVEPDPARAAEHYAQAAAQGLPQAQFNLARLELDAATRDPQAKARALARLRALPAEFTGPISAVLAEHDLALEAAVRISEEQ